MRSRDPEPIQAALDKLQNKHAQHSMALQKLEQLRDRIVDQGDSAISDALLQYPDADRQRLRQLARQAQKEQQQNKPPKAYREIFQYLKGFYDQNL